jgi:hypothetical protein
MWAQAYESARLSFGGVEVCAYLTLTATLHQASELVVALATTVTAGNALAWDLVQAWTRLVDDTLRAFPSPAQRLTTRDHGYWVTKTGREVTLVGVLQGKVQRRLSVGSRVLQVRDATSGMHEARTAGWSERLALFEAVQASECSKPYRAIRALGLGTRLAAIDTADICAERLSPGTPDAGKFFTSFSRHNFAKNGPGDLKMV